MTPLALRTSSQGPYKLKVKVGGVNVALPRTSVSWMPKQDYFVTPLGEMIHGVRVAKSTVRQFLALTPGTEFSAEFQMTGRVAVQDVEIEVFLPRPEWRPKCSPSGFHVFIKQLNGRSFVVNDIFKSTSIGQFKAESEKVTGLRQDEMRLIYNSRQLEDDKTLEDYNINSGDIMHLVLRLRGGGDPDVMEIVPGGLISETMKQDEIPDRWMAEAFKTFTIKVVSPDDFRALTGESLEPPILHGGVIQIIGVDDNWADEETANDTLKGLSQMSAQQPGQHVQYSAFQGPSGGAQASPNYAQHAPSLSTSPSKQRREKVKCLLRGLRDKIKRNYI